MDFRFLFDYIKPNQFGIKKFFLLPLIISLAISTVYSTYVRNEDEAIDKTTMADGRCRYGSIPYTISLYGIPYSTYLFWRMRVVGRDVFISSPTAHK